MSQIHDNVMQNRLANFKHNGKDVEEMRRRRSSASIELRKTSRFDQMLKKRNIAVNNSYSPVEEGNSPDQKLVSMTIPEIMSEIISEDLNVVFRAVKEARKILSRERNPPIESMIKAGIVPYLVQFLSPVYRLIIIGTDQILLHKKLTEVSYCSEHFQFEACWALTNLASGNSKETEAIINAEALPKLIALLESPHEKVAEQAAWAIGNIAGDGPPFRDQVINLNALPALSKLLENELNISTTKNVVWTISNLCRNNNPPPPFFFVKTCLPVLSKMLYSTDPDVIADTCWSLSYLTDGTEERIQATIEAGVVPRLVELLSSAFESDANYSILTPALRTVGNIVTGNDMQTDCIINAGALPKLGALLTVKKLNIVKEAAWSISNITAGNSDQIQAVIDAGILPPLIKVLNSGDFKSQKEAAWAIANFTSSATIHQFSCLFREGVLTPLCTLLSSKDPKIVHVVLDAIYNILYTAEKIGELHPITLFIEECGGVDNLENLQNHENKEIYKKALKIIDQFFSSEDNGENEILEELNGHYNFKPAEPTGRFNF